MVARPSVLFVCRNNSALSLMAEALTMHAFAHVRAFSAGVFARDPVDMEAIECLHAARVPADGLSAKPLELFGFSGAPRIDLVVPMVTAAHGAARRMRLHAPVRIAPWTFEDVSHIADAHERRLAYRRVLPEIRSALSALFSDGGCGRASAAA